ncbi:MAG TPA: redox-sensing transcriptional repressor Rex [Bacillota bacterium]|jgi:redox-sensing transcriptional repressor|nr:redox-sensing transcriptional repressor Rex [Fastidiosipila sp.]HPX93494.1 redox-sensing transcriptional repressor Rex [Bacillota bacterium]HQB81265.1 redox-sensing transcriptional repressor Rex [Bacillota bacterium]
MASNSLSFQTLQRLPYYLDYLREVETENVSSTAIAAEFRLHEVQVRKDLASVSRQAGQPRKGFATKALIKDIEDILGYGHVDEAVIVGVGHLGTALANYAGFEKYGLKIVAGFDTRIASEEYLNQTPLYPMEKLDSLIRERGIRLGIITVDGANAQAVCDQLVEAGVEAIWNFAPVLLQVPEGIIVQNENMACALAILSHHLRK